MKLKHLACRFISACLALVFLVTPVFAEGGGQNDNDWINSVKGEY